MSNTTYTISYPSSLSAEFGVPLTTILQLGLYLFFFIMGLNFVDPSNESIILLFLLVLLLKQRQKQKAAECAMVSVTTSVLLERKSNQQNRENDHTNMTAPFPSAQRAWYYGRRPRWNPRCCSLLSFYLSSSFFPSLLFWRG